MVDTTPAKTRKPDQKKANGARNGLQIVHLPSIRYYQLNARS